MGSAAHGRLPDSHEGLVPLSHEEKERIMEEEAVRLEGRMKAHAALEAKGPGGPHGPHDDGCERCGHQKGCRGCRLWGWIFAVLVGLCVIHFLCARQERCCYWNHGDRGMMGWSGPHGDMDGPGDGRAPEGPAPKGGPKPAPEKP